MKLYAILFLISVFSIGLAYALDIVRTLNNGKVLYNGRYMTLNELIELNTVRSE